MKSLKTLAQLANGEHRTPGLDIASFTAGY